MATSLCIGTSLQVKQQPTVFHSLPSIQKAFRPLDPVPLLPDLSPGASSVGSTDRAPMPDENFDYCDNCANHIVDVHTYAQHVIDYHLKPRRLPSATYYETLDKSDDLLKRPYTTLYPSKKRKPDSDRVPRPQNQYMIFSNYIRTPLMKYFGDINHAQISQAISTVWKKLTEVQKQPFKEESKQCENIHKQEFPNYKYKPKQKKAKKPEITANPGQSHLETSPAPSDDLSPPESKYMDSSAVNSLYVNVNVNDSVPSLHPPITNPPFLSARSDLHCGKFSQPVPFDHYSPVGDTHAFGSHVSEPQPFQAYSPAQPSIITIPGVGDGPMISQVKSGPLFIKRDPTQDPVLSQNTAPQPHQLSADTPITLASSWSAGMNSDFAVSDNPHFIVMQNGTSMTLNDHVMQGHDLALACSASSDQSISDAHLLTESAMLSADIKIGSFINNQPMEIDHPRDHINGFEASSLPNYEIYEKKELIDHRDGFDDLMTYDDSNFIMNPTAM